MTRGGNRGRLAFCTWHCSEPWAAGVDVKTAQTRLGHSSPQMTLGIYARATADSDRRAADVVWKMFAPRDARGMDAPEGPRGGWGKLP